MAILEEGFLPMTGSVGKISVYKRKDIDKLIVRAKSGPRSKSVLKADSYTRTRELNQEWSGCALAGKNIRIAMHPLTHMADYNISGPLSAIMKVIQKMDNVNRHGERNIDISKYRMLLNGFSLNKQNYWESLIKSRPTNWQGSH